MMRRRLALPGGPGKRFSSPLFTLVFDTEATARKIGFIAGRKVGTAAVRNRIKRIIREEWNTTHTPGDAVFILRKEAVEARRERFRKEIGRASSAAGSRAR